MPYTENEKVIVLLCNLDGSAPAQQMMLGTSVFQHCAAHSGCLRCWLLEGDSQQASNCQHFPEGKEFHRNEDTSSYNLMKKRQFRCTFQTGCTIAKPFIRCPPQINTPGNVFLFFHSIVSPLPSATILPCNSFTPNNKNSMFYLSRVKYN